MTLPPAPQIHARPDETAEARLKRMQMRAWRRGMKEMDLILGPWAEADLASLDAETLDLVDRLLTENDQEILPWFIGQAVPPAHYAALIERIGIFARGRLIR